MAALKTIYEKGKYLDEETYGAVTRYVTNKARFYISAGVSRDEDIASVMKTRNAGIDTEGKQLVVHSVITFGSKKVPTSNSMKGLSKAIARECGKNCETLVAIHDNYDCHPHIHIVMNAFDYAGNYYYDDESGRKELKRVVKSELELRGQKLTRVRKDGSRADW